MSNFLRQFFDIILQNTTSIPIVIGIVFGAVLLGIIIHSIIYSVLRSLGRYRGSKVYPSLITHTKGAARWFIIFFTVNLSLPLLFAQKPWLESCQGFVRSIIDPLIIASLSWLLIKLINVLEDMIYLQYHIDKGDMTARRINTQFQLLKRILIIVIVVFAVGTILMTFDRIRQLGTAILASAGIIGIIVGVAAQRSVANLLAGIQIALTEPIRLGDTVIVEGEFGTVEKITLTYVVVRVWDKRRIVLPIVHFIEKSFQNWTHERTNLLGTVFVYVDYTVPVEDIRVELLRLLRESPKWDGSASGLQVTNLTPNTVEIRALMSAENSGDLWDLRCEIRERLIAFIRERYPESLPKLRAEIQERGSGLTES